MTKPPTVFILTDTGNPVSGKEYDSNMSAPAEVYTSYL